MTKIVLHKKLPEEAKEIRRTVFMEEQGFKDEFDDVDDMALHLIVYVDDRAVGTCRIFWEEEKGMYVIGRLAIRKEYRGMHLGAELLERARAEIDALGGKEIYIHAQLDKERFYERQGYRRIGEVEPEQGYPHIWMLLEWE